ncbi:MAG: hypothetical protein DRP51_06910 [Candidatus Zixiibacteriota bacterium]|nr:MAG: hypothetical protein DRP51_06910 [candidate division Zixibacteria bacterium]HHI03594.1 DinB family protein [candidate division Zixibacteria bacterium]
MDKIGKKENLKKLLESNHCSIKALIDDISEEESMRHDYAHCNHIRWQTGHIIDSARIILKLLGRDIETPEEWQKIFGWKSKLFENASIYPPMSELREQLYSFYEQRLQALDNFPSDDLDKEIELSGGWKTTPMDGILFLCTHEFYHAGQITVMRRVLGRDRPFG